jgi:D-alanyl-lipoteichoic acid acyltransferase DltB (MBOAT superfamily)
LKQVASRANRKELTLSEYVRRRNGVPLGASGSLTSMLKRSLGARSFAAFWQHWNPIFGFCLGKYVYAPLKTTFSAGISLSLTFVVCGLIHDLVIMAVRQDVAFIFTPWFFLLGVGVVLSQRAKMDFAQYPWAVRAMIHLTYLGSCLALASFMFISRIGG